MASPQPTDSHTRISNELYTQILMRDFTKRQRAILDLIIRFSYGCGKKTALLTQTKIFTLCGVQHNKVRKELNELRKMSVIDWDELEGRYWINKDYDVWDIERPEEESEQYFAEILRVNINDQKGHAQNGHDQKGQSDMTKKVNESCPKRSIESSEIVDGSKPDEPPITKDNYKEIENIKDKHTEVLNKLAEFFPFGMSSASKYDIEEFMKNIADIELLDIAHNMAVEQKANSKEKYIIGVLRRFLNNGITTLAQYREQETQKQQYIQRPAVYSLDTVPRGMGKRALEAMLEDEELERQQRLLAESAK